jgi:DNA-binding winged helix-turn-helix (wHTH) protein/Flp pilus assembly protein TadD
MFFRVVQPFLRCFWTFRLPIAYFSVQATSNQPVFLHNLPVPMPGGSSVYRFGPFEFDPLRGRLFRGATRVPLADSQVAILLQLVSCLGDVVSKDTLAKAAWPDAAVTDNSVDQAISRLRKILGGGQHRTRDIETVPNRGYRFVSVVERTTRYDPAASSDAPLAPYRAFVHGEDELDTLDRDAILRARREFEKALRETPDYADAHVGLANACAFAYEATRADVEPDVASLQLAIDHALKACELEPASADAWSTRAFAFCLNGDTDEAEAAACKAVDLDSKDWQHAMRLAYVSWGETRLRAARRVLKLCPGLALAHYLMATVFVARQAFEAALELLQDGCAAQDAQALSTGGYPGVALHLHRGRVLAAMGDVEKAIDELTRELDAPHHGQVYARECIANTWYTLGALHQRQGRRNDATAAFKQALTVVPGHMSATAALGGDPQSPRRRRDPNSIDLAVAQAIILARTGRHGEAAQLCADALAQAPRGCAGWLLPAEPMLNPAARPDIWAPTLAILRNRAI